MTRQQFDELTAKGVVILDGATGSNLRKAGMPVGISSEQWVLENPSVLQELQRAYVDAGSQIVYAPTFAANPISLRNFNLQDRVAELNTKLVKICKDGIGNRALVAGDITTTGQLMEPRGTLTYNELYEAYQEQMKALVDAGVDFVVETNDFWVASCADIFEEEGIMHTSAYCVLAPGYITPEHTMAFTGSNGTGGDYATAFAALNKYYPDVKSVILANDDNGLKEEMLGLMQKYAEPYGIEVKGMVIYPGTTTDYTPYAQQLVDSGADAFLGNGSPDAYGALLKAVRALGSDMVCACAQGKTAPTLMEYAGADACYNAFTLGPSTREADKEQNTDILNALVAKVAEKYGAENAATFDGAAANCLYIMLQLMQKCGSVDPAVVAAEWEKGGQVETIYGTGTIGGEETYGVANHAVGSPRSVSIIDPEAEEGWYFAEWIPTEVP